MDSSRLQGEALKKARKEGLLSVTFTQGGRTIIREVMTEEVWDDPAVFLSYCRGLGRRLFEAYTFQKG